MNKWTAWGITLIMIAGFQNCGQVGFGAKDESSIAKASVENADDPKDDGRSSESEPDEDEVVSDPISPAACANFVAKPFSPSLSASGQRHIVGQRGPFALSNVAEVTLLNMRGPIELKGITRLANAQDLRGPASVEADHVVNYLNFRGSRHSIQTERLDLLQNGRGGTEIAADRIGLILDIRGDLCVGTARAEIIQNIRGNISVFGPSASSRAKIDLILDTRGILVLENVEVKMLQNHRGQVRLINSVIENQLDVQ